MVISIQELRKKQQEQEDDTRRQPIAEKSPVLGWFANHSQAERHSRQGVLKLAQYFYQN